MARNKIEAFLSTGNSYHLSYPEAFSLVLEGKADWVDRQCKAINMRPERTKVRGEVLGWQPIPSGGGVPVWQLVPGGKYREFAREMPLG